MEVKRMKITPFVDDFLLVTVPILCDGDNHKFRDMVTVEQCEQTYNIMIDVCNHENVNDPWNYANWNDYL